MASLKIDSNSFSNSSISHNGAELMDSIDLSLQEQLERLRTMRSKCRSLEDVVKTIELAEKYRYSDLTRKNPDFKKEIQMLSELKEKYKKINKTMRAADNEKYLFDLNLIKDQMKGVTYIRAMNSNPLAKAVVERKVAYLESLVDEGLFDHAVEYIKLDGMGEKRKLMHSDYNTNFDHTWSAHTKFKALAKESHDVRVKQTQTTERIIMKSKNLRDESIRLYKHERFEVPLERKILREKEKEVEREKLSARVRKLREDESRRYHASDYSYKKHSLEKEKKDPSSKYSRHITERPKASSSSRRVIYPSENSLRSPSSSISSLPTDRSYSLSRFTGSQAPAKPVSLNLSSSIKSRASSNNTPSSAYGVSVSGSLASKYSRQESSSLNSSYRNPYTLTSE